MVPPPSISPFHSQCNIPPNRGENHKVKSQRTRRTSTLKHGAYTDASGRMGMSLGENHNETPHLGYEGSWVASSFSCDVSTLFRTKNLVGFSGLLLEQWSKIAMRCMTALAVIEHLNIRKYRCLGCLVCAIVLRIDPCSL